MNRVLFVMPFLKMGGAEKQHIYMINELNESYKDLDITVMLFNDQEISKEYIEVNKIISIPNTLWISNKYFKTLIRFINYIYLFFYIFFKVPTFDTIYLYSKVFIPLIPIFKVKSKRVIFSLREADDKVTRFPYYHILKQCTHITCNSLVTYNLMHKKGMDIKLINNAIQNKLLENIEVPNDIHEIGVVSNIHPRKNIEVVIKSLKYCPKDINIEIIGRIVDKDYYNYLLDLIKKENLVTRVKFGGYLNNIDMFYKSKDLIILASHFEGTSNVILESFNHCKLIIVSDIDENKTLFNREEHKFFVFDRNSPKDLAEKILKTKEIIVSNPDFIKKIFVRRKKILKEDYSVRKMAESIYSLLK